MKYIKLFESKDELYWEIPKDELFHIYGKLLFETVDFTKTQLIKLEEIANKLSLSGAISTDRFGSRGFYFHNDKFDAKIFKAKDDWYYIHFTEIKKDLMSSFFSKINWNDMKETYYKCDQWDGLLACLENIIMK